MAKLSMIFAAFLFFVAHAIQAQAPDGAAAASRGNDAVAASLVNTVCASCHTLDRVNGKKADRDGWTTTVARMRGLGANLTDEQVPAVVEFLTRAAGTLTVAAAGGGGRGGRGGPRPSEVGEEAGWRKKHQAVWAAGVVSTLLVRSH